MLFDMNYILKFMSHKSPWDDLPRELNAYGKAVTGGWFSGLPLSLYKQPRAWPLSAGDQAHVSVRHVSPSS